MKLLFTRGAPITIMRRTGLTKTSEKSRHPRKCHWVPNINLIQRWHRMYKKPLMHGMHTVEEALDAWHAHSRRKIWTPEINGWLACKHKPRSNNFPFKIRQYPFPGDIHNTIVTRIHRYLDEKLNLVISHNTVHSWIATLAKFMSNPRKGHLIVITKEFAYLK